MLNPLRSEEEAFRFLLYAIAVIVAIVAARGDPPRAALRAARRRRRYLTVSVPNMPAARWPGAWQKNV